MHGAVGACDRDLAGRLWGSGRIAAASGCSRKRRERDQHHRPTHHCSILGFCSNAVETAALSGYRLRRQTNRKAWGLLSADGPRTTCSRKGHAAARPAQRSIARLASATSKPAEGSARRCHKAPRPVGQSCRRCRRVARSKKTTRAWHNGNAGACWWKATASDGRLAAANLLEGGRTRRMVDQGPETQRQRGRGSSGRLPGRLPPAGSPRASGGRTSQW